VNRETVQLWLNEGICSDAFESKLQDRLEDVGVVYHLGRNIEGTFCGGNFTLDLVWGKEIDQDVFTGLSDIERLDRVFYSVIDQGCRSVQQHNTVWRTLLLRVKPGFESTIVEQFERDLLAMPEYMQGIRRWALSRVNSDLQNKVNGESRWTHVWQQEYQQLDDLMGEYLIHPYHWGWVDHYFDPEFPDCLVDSQISHCFCPLQRSLIDEEIWL
jgi:hypothetical protein